MKTSTRSAVILSAALLLGWSTATLAAPSLVGTVATKKVRFADLDISTAEGARTLYERIAAAARPFVVRSMLRGIFLDGCGAATRSFSAMTVTDRK